MIQSTYDLSKSGSNFVKVNIEGYPNLKTVYLELTQDGVTFSNKIGLVLVKQPNITSIKPSIFNSDLVGPYRIGISGS